MGASFLSSARASSALRAAYTIPCLCSSNSTPSALISSIRSNTSWPSRAMAAVPSAWSRSLQYVQNRSSHGASRLSSLGLKYRAESRSNSARIPYSVSPGSGSGPACAGHSQPPFRSEAPLPMRLLSITVTSYSLRRR